MDGVKNRRTHYKLTNLHHLNNAGELKTDNAKQKSKCKAIIIPLAFAANVSVLGVFVISLSFLKNRKDTVKRDVSLCCDLFHNSCYFL